MYRTTLSAAALSAAPALAGGMAEPVVMAPVEAPAPVASDWTGFYGGLQLEFFNNGTDRNFNTDADFQGTLIGIFGGYRYDFGTVVAGVEFDYLHGTGDQDILNGVNAGETFDVDYTVHRIGVEVGYDAGPALFSVGAGYAELGFDTFNGDFEDPGYYYGIGIDYRVSENVTVGAEINQNVFDNFVFDENDLKFTTFGANVAFTF